MKPADDLKRTLFRIHEKGYKAYQDIEGEYLFSQYQLVIDRVQADPFAPPSRFRVLYSLKKWKIMADFWENPVRRMAFCDYVGRQVQQAIRTQLKRQGGSGKSGLLQIEAGGPEILERTSVVIEGETLELRLTVGLPAAGRTILGMEAVAIFFEEIPLLVQHGVQQIPNKILEVKRFVDAYEDQEWLRDQLRGKQLIAFIPEGAILPRESGVSSRPLALGAVPFWPPQESFRHFSTPPQRVPDRHGPAPRGDPDRGRRFSRQIDPLAGLGIGYLQPHPRGRPGICGHRPPGRKNPGRRRPERGKSEYQPLYPDPAPA